MRGESREWSFYSDRIQVRIEGIKIDRLIDKCLKQGVKIKEMKMVSETEAMCWIPQKDLKILQKNARSIYRITLLSEKGLYSATKKVARKHYLLAGTVLVIFFVVFQSKLVYSVHIEGYRSIPEEQLRICLERQGVADGAYIPNIHWQKARDSIFYTFPQVTWVQLVYDGRVVYLKISETDHKLYGDYEKYCEGMESDDESLGKNNLYEN